MRGWSDADVSGSRRTRPRNIQERIERAQAELAAAQAELREAERFEPDALYLINNDGPRFLAYGRDLSRRADFVRATKFAYADDGHVPKGGRSKSPLPGAFAPNATFTKVDL